jgi:hypothetical protein
LNAENFLTFKPIAVWQKILCNARIFLCGAHHFLYGQIILSNACIIH